MRIASEIRMLACLMMAPVLIGSVAAQAADTLPAPQANIPAPMMVPVDPNAPKGVAGAEKQIPDSVKEVMKRLDKPAEDVTLDDLNSARQAVAKIEILIDLEKHLAELDKIRREREGSSMSAMIPASALQPPMAARAGFGAPVGMPENAGPTMPVAMAGGGIEVTQIAGGDGHYTAILKGSGDDGKTVHVGDKLSDGGTIVGMTATEVVVDRNGTTHTLHVKNISTVFGNSF